MGNMQAGAFSDAVAGGEISLDSALIWHLRANHFPPIPLDFLPVAKEAIEHAEAEDWEYEITMPNELTRTVAQIVEGMHLDSFITGD